MGRTTKQPVVIEVDKGLPTTTMQVAAVPAKPAHKSATVIINGLITFGGLLAFVDPTQVQALVGHYVPNPDLAVALSGLIAATLGVVNVLIRIYKTKQPIS